MVVGTLEMVENRGRYISYPLQIIMALLTKYLEISVGALSRLPQGHAFRTCLRSQGQ